jgi:hypothetical protein
MRRMRAVNASFWRVELVGFGESIGARSAAAAIFGAY